MRICIFINDWLINTLYCFFGSEGHVALDRNPGAGYDTLLARLIPGHLLSACPHRQFHTLPGFLDSWAALPNSYPNALRAGRQFVSFVWRSLVRPSRDANPRPTVWKADMITTKPTRHGLYSYIYDILPTILTNHTEIVYMSHWTSSKSSYSFGGKNGNLF